MQKNASDSHTKLQSKNPEQRPDAQREQISADSIPLSADEERSLLKRMKQGDSSARYALMLSHSSVVDRVTHQYRSCGLPLDELRALGNIGLSRAAERYDISIAPRFFIYAEYWIKRSIRHAIGRHKSQG